MLLQPHDTVWVGHRLNEEDARLAWEIALSTLPNRQSSGMHALPLALGEAVLEVGAMLESMAVRIVPLDEAEAREMRVIIGTAPTEQQVRALVESYLPRDKLEKFVAPRAELLSGNARDAQAWMVRTADQAYPGTPDGLHWSKNLRTKQLWYLQRRTASQVTPYLHRLKVMAR
jgi:hypothetical protein